MSDKASMSFAEAGVKQENRKENETIGAYLKRVRTTCGHTLEEVAQVTKINLRYLDAIENDEFSKIPGDTFLQGFLRSYARFLNIDEHEITGKLKGINKTESVPSKIHAAEEYKKDIGSSIRITPKNIKIILTAAGGLVLIIFLILLFGSARDKSTVQSSKNINSPAVPVTEDVKQGLAVTASGQPVAIKVYAKELTWMQANIDGNNIQEKLLKPGEEASWNAQEKIIITIGNAGGIDLEINGKKQEPLGKSGAVLKGIVVTSAGVSGG